MDLVYRDQWFYVSKVKKSRREEDREYYSVDIEFKSDQDIIEHALAHVIWGVQSEIRERQAIERGEKEAPKGYEPYPLKPIPKWDGDKMPKGWNPKANATVKSDSTVVPKAADRLAALLASDTTGELEAALKAAGFVRANNQ